MTPIIKFREKDRAKEQKTEKALIDGDTASLMWENQVHIQIPLRCIIRLVARIEQGVMMECKESTIDYVGAKLMIGDTVELYYKKNGQQKVEKISTNSLLSIYTEMQR